MIAQPSAVANITSGPPKKVGSRDTQLRHTHAHTHNCIKRKREKGEGNGCQQRTRYGHRDTKRAQGWMTWSVTKRLTFHRQKSIPIHWVIPHFCSWCDVRWGNVSEPNVSQVRNQPVFAQCELEYESRQRDITCPSPPSVTVCPPRGTCPTVTASSTGRDIVRDVSTPCYTGTEQTSLLLCLLIHLIRCRRGVVKRGRWKKMWS